MKFIPKGMINNIPALVQTMAWRRPGDKPLSEPTMTYFADAYSISQEICTWFCCALLCCGYAIVHEVFIHIHQECVAGTGAIVILPQCQ